MKPSVFTFEDAERQTVYYRGYVTVYDGMSTAEVSCKEVRKNKLKAMEDAKKLIKSLRQK